MMATKALRRLAADHANLHRHGLPPNYLFPANSESSDLTVLSVLLAGPDNTPYSTGLFHLDLRMESGTYPATAPTACFRTKIFHPNVDPSTGAVCVDTLKRDWKPELTLRDVLITINCLLVCPNPASALNAEAGKLMEEDFSFFERRAAMWAEMFASVPASIQEAVNEAKSRVIGETSTASLGAMSKRKQMKQPVVSKESPMEVENTPVMLQTPDYSTTRTLATPSMGQQGKTVGLGMLNMDLHTHTSTIVTTTPTLPPRRANRKRYAMLPPQTQIGNSPTTDPSAQMQTPSFSSTQHSSFSSSFITPTPTTAPTFAEPPAKRRRTNSLSPPASSHGRQSSGIQLDIDRLINPLLPRVKRTPTKDPFHPSFQMPWLDWRKHLDAEYLDDRPSVNVEKPKARRGIFRL